MNLENELPINYYECSKEQLIELILKRDEDFIKLGKEYLEVMDTLGNILPMIESEADKTMRTMKTEFALSQAGVPSSDEKIILEKEVGRMEAFIFIINALNPIYNKKNKK